MRLVDARSEIEVVDRDACLRLLETAEVGRIAFITGAGTPDVLPVNYVLDGEAVVFATGAGSKLTATGRGPVAFEVDDTDPARRTGWSVVIHGHAEEITAYASPDLLRRVRAQPPTPWARGERPHLVRIVATTITGRRIA